MCWSKFFFWLGPTLSPQVWGEGGLLQGAGGTLYEMNTLGGPTVFPNIRGIPLYSQSWCGGTLSQNFRGWALYLHGQRGALYPHRWGAGVSISTFFRFCFHGFVGVPPLVNGDYEYASNFPPIKSSGRSCYQTP